MKRRNILIVSLIKYQICCNIPNYINIQLTCETKIVTHSQANWL